MGMRLWAEKYRVQNLPRFEQIRVFSMQDYESLLYIVYYYLVRMGHDRIVIVITGYTNNNDHFN